MITLKRFKENPVLAPKPDNVWEAEAVFNGATAIKNKAVRLLYRAMSAPMVHEGAHMSLSSVGYAESSDGVNFINRRQFIKPEHAWERFGCEDPRITELNGRYFIFYTALSGYPFNAENIKVGLAITHDFKTMEKHPVTTFNSKAMTLFPGRVNGKVAAILTANTDRPPVRIGIALFDNEKQIWSKKYWDGWYANLENHALILQRSSRDHVEVGAAPLLTKYGWLLIYSYIKNYFIGSPVFSIEAVLLDIKDPKKIIGRTREAMLTPETPYEKEGKVPNIVFPSGAYIKDGRLVVSYGAADTNCSFASCDLNKLLEEMKDSEILNVKIERYKKNPILTPKSEHAWEAKAVFNPGALYANERIHLVYRAMSNENISTLGYAAGSDGFNITERLNKPIYSPREDFESMGCEDPRLTLMGSTVYMCYTAFDGHQPRVALTSISLKNFLDKKWTWSKPKLISSPGADDKDAAVFPEKFGDRYAIAHRLGVSIEIDFVKTLNFSNKKWLKGSTLLAPRDGMWDSEKVGLSATPIKTKKGWLLLYHGISKEDRKYRLGAVLLDLDDPTKILARTDRPIMEPETPYEIAGQTANVIFPCGAVVVDKKLFVYYGGADSVIGAATWDISKLFDDSKKTVGKTKKIERKKGISLEKKRPAAIKKKATGRAPKPLKHHIKNFLNYKLF